VDDHRRGGNCGQRGDDRAHRSIDGDDDGQCCGKLQLHGVGEWIVHGDAEPERVYVQSGESGGDGQRSEYYGGGLHGYGADVDDYGWSGNLGQQCDDRADGNVDGHDDGQFLGQLHFYGVGERVVHRDAEPERVYVQSGEPGGDGQRSECYGAELHRYGADVDDHGWSGNCGQRGDDRTDGNLDGDDDRQFLGQLQLHGVGERVLHRDAESHRLYVQSDECGCGGQRSECYGAELHGYCADVDDHG
jgi:hypothetical protein